MCLVPLRQSLGVREHRGQLLTHPGGRGHQSTLSTCTALQLSRMGRCSPRQTHCSCRAPWQVEKEKKRCSSGQRRSPRIISDTLNGRNNNWNNNCYRQEVTTKGPEDTWAKPYAVWMQPVWSKWSFPWTARRWALCISYPVGTRSTWGCNLYNLICPPYMYVMVKSLSTIFPFASQE